MVKIVRTPAICRQYMTNEELYGGWPKHGMFAGESKPIRRKKSVIIDNSELEKIIEEEDDCCVSPDEI